MKIQPLLLPLLSFGVALLAVRWTILICHKKGLHDVPNGDALKIHKHPIPNMGGLGFFFAFALGWIALVVGVLSRH